ncbi:OLC1v1013747C1 [Oldenlandia corymbosa var. corymbosa]|uniref:OLC1v1013747C1 n=1 Tax=Oldenlandia corymbosa var. corymbosa TaxID=529605 RepID=A0AAV1E1J7_OLDCO|nr:OLC1v1013747C1 [Oldenlandia corymbosa var. corymbosa]
MAELNQFEGQSNGGIGETMAGTTAKRQRRPSVRLGDIGGDTPLGYENLDPPQRRGSSKQQRQLKYPWNPPQKGARGKSSETLVVDKNGNFDNDDGKNGGFANEVEDDDGDLDLDRVAIGSWKSFRDLKSKRGRGGSVRKRVRSNWVSSKIDGSQKLLTNGGDGDGEGEDGFNLDNDEEVDRDFRRDNSDDEEEEEERNQSPVHSFDNDEDVMDREQRGFSKSGRRVARSDEMEGPSDSVERNGVKIWLNQLGLGRYAPVFEVHEVDDEVLPMLTLEDLKDMGISAVGTRRKMFCSIQKLNRGFS